ncbi:EAL domain-containing protein [Plastorhodobacter daqingensis]|uniref:EAL domain-containing protein n=1 Tax=Plastorhodobacter daqingensis TaxID=1387281 RepID=A0ABW2UG25_9RHOB
MGMSGSYDLGAGGDSSPLSFALAERDRETLTLVRRAVEARRVMLAFQPVVQARRPDRPAFYEGLARIMDSNGRVIPARDFIDVAETTELGRMIDCLALELGLETLAQQPGLRLSINMSARSIGYPRWLRTLEAGLAPDPTIAERLILEVTESSAMAVPDLVSVFIDDLHARGITFALDDFGAGYTAFRFFKEFFFDVLKIDGQFIRGIHANTDNQVLTKALISIARHFEMFTVAESVECAEDAAYLTSIGIDCMQGYYFGSPSLSPVWLSPTAATGG